MERGILTIERAHPAKEYPPRADRKREEYRARILCESGDYHTMLSTLKQESLFESQKERIVSKYGERLDVATFLTDSDWEMLVVLELYDSGTFEHSLRVFETVFEKLESDHYIGIFLRQHLLQERVEKADLLRAALLHDIGKVTISKAVLNDATTDEEWEIIAKTCLQPDRYEETIRVLEENPSLRYKDILPFSVAVSEELSASIRAQGVDPDQPIGAIIGRHRYDSGMILRSYGKEFRIAAEIAENHHDCPIKEERFPTSISSLRASWILRAADILDAMRHPRAYKNGASLEHALDIIDLEAERGFIDHKVAALFRDHEYSRNKNRAGAAGGYADIIGLSASLPDSHAWTAGANERLPRHTAQHSAYH